MTGATTTWTTPAGAASTRSVHTRLQPGPALAGCFAAREVGTEPGSRLGVGWGQETSLPPCLSFPHSIMKHPERYR